MPPDRTANVSDDAPDAARGGAGPANPWLAADVSRGEAYDRRFDELASSGAHVHGEADLVMSFAPASVLDAGCGTGRVAIELARRGVEVVGVDLDPAMLERAREKAPELEWRESDLASLDLGRSVDLVVAAGNVMIFLDAGSEGTVLGALARHLHAGGLLIAGYSLGPGRLTVDEYDRLAAATGLALVERWSGWDRETFTPDSSYSVSLHVQRRGA
ncbi:MAG TPA: class I SAM-dependent methyltransferase [Acidimicrobiales bacterium]|nr:class I SAM-dependent methyltransferase [Acidimicrobiales bacterium]